MSDKQEIEYRNLFTWIFSINYLFQGIVTSMYAVIIPIYLLKLAQEGGIAIQASDIAFLGSLITIPWAIKLFFGMITDKFSIKNWGRRRPWAVLNLSFAGVLWIILPFLVTPQNAILVFTTTGFIINLGVAFSDTALDGFIVDICPPERLGRVQGFCWGLRSVGAIAGGPLFAALIVFLNLPVQYVFIILGISMIFSSITINVIEEKEIKRKIKLGPSFKAIFKEGKDWKTFMFALFNNLLADVMLVFLSLYILIQIGLVQFTGELSLGTKDVGIYQYQANITMIISLGIVVGSILGGRLADLRSRKFSVYSSLIITTVALLLLLIPTYVVILLFFGSIIGLALGWRHSAYAAVVSQMAKHHPDVDSTYLSVANSFTNLGSVIGLALVGVILDLFLSFEVLIVFMALISNLTAIPFAFMDPTYYEHKLLEKSITLEKE